MAQFSPLKMQSVAQGFLKQLRHAHALNLSVVDANHNWVVLQCPYQAQTASHQSIDMVHSGVISTLMDTAAGTAVLCALFHATHLIELSPTLDLRVDYMKPAEPKQPIYGFAECYRYSRNIAFTRGVAYQEDIDNPIAHVVASFMRVDTDYVTDEFRQQVLQEGI